MSFLIIRININNFQIILGYLIYPSLNESFGLPLIEAAQLDLVIIASDLPYVNEIISNYYSFNPLDINDISLNVEKVLNLIKPNTATLRIKSEELALINYINESLIFFFFLIINIWINKYLKN